MWSGLLEPSHFSRVFSFTCQLRVIWEKNLNRRISPSCLVDMFGEFYWYRKVQSTVDITPCTSRWFKNCIGKLARQETEKESGSQLCFVNFTTKFLLESFTDRLWPGSWIKCFPALNCFWSDFTTHNRKKIGMNSNYNIKEDSIFLIDDDTPDFWDSSILSIVPFLTLPSPSFLVSFLKILDI